MFTVLGADKRKPRILSDRGVCHALCFTWNVSCLTQSWFEVIHIMLRWHVITLIY